MVTKWKRLLAVVLAAFLLVPSIPNNRIVFASEEGTTETTPTEETNTEETTQYTVTYDTNGGAFEDGSTSVKSIYSEGVELGFPETIPTREGYQFLGWSLDRYAESASSYENEQVFSDMDFFAVWQEEVQTYTVTFDANGGAFSDGETTRTWTGAENDEQEIYPESPRRSGYLFLGWSKDSEAETASYDPEIEIWVNFYADETYYAVWKDMLSGMVELRLGEEVTASCDPDEGWSRFYFTAPDDGTYFFISTSNGECDPRAELRNDEYSIADNDDGYYEQDFLIEYSMVQGETVYLYTYGSNEEDVFPVKVVDGPLVNVTAYTAQGQFSNGSDSITFQLLEGQNVYSNVPEGPTVDDGHLMLSGWSDDPNAYDVNYSMRASEGFTCYAVWHHISIFTYHAEGGYILDMDEMRTDEATIPISGDSADAAEWFDWNYQIRNDDTTQIFLGWALEPGATEPLQDTYIEHNGQDVDLYAVWVTGVHVTFDAQGGELYDDSEKYVQPGTPLAHVEMMGYKTIDDKGYGILGWSTEPGAAEPNVTGDFEITEDITLYAVWGPRVNVRLWRDGYEQEDWTTISIVAGRTYGPKYFGDPQDYQEDLYFVGWSKTQDDDPANVADLVFTEDTTLYPVWRGPVQVTYKTEYGSFWNGNQEYTETYNPGSWFTEVDIDYDGYMQLSGWKLEDGTPITSSDRVNDDITVYAVWSEPSTYITLHVTDGGYFGTNPDETERKVYYSEYDSEVWVSCDDITPSDTSKAFIGWATTPDAVDREYGKNSDVPTSVTDLYTVWAEAVEVTLVTPDVELACWHDADGNALGTTTVYVAKNDYFPYSYSPMLNEQGYYFRGWSRDPKATEPEEILITEPITLYAVFERMAQVTFNLNGGYYTKYTDEMEEVLEQFTDDFQLYLNKGYHNPKYLADEFFDAHSYGKDGGYVLAGWAKDPDTTPRQMGSSIEITEDELTLYAVWDKMITVTIHERNGEPYNYEASTSRTLRQQGLLYGSNWYQNEEPNERYFLIGYATEEGGPVVYGPNDILPETVTDLYEVWESFTNLEYPDLTVDQQADLGSISDETYSWASFTPEEDGAYAFKLVPSNCDLSDAWLFDGNDQTYLSWNWGSDAEGEAIYLPCALEQGKKYYLYLDLQAQESGTRAVATAKLSVVKAAQVVYHLNDTETMTEVVTIGQTPIQYVPVTPPTQDDALAGWAYSPNATTPDVTNVHEMTVTEATTIDLYPVWVNYVAQAETLQIAQEKTFHCTPETTYFAFTPETTGAHIVILRQDENAAQPVYYSGIRIDGIETSQNVIRSHRSMEDWNAGYYLFQPDVGELQAGTTYYLQVSCASENDWTISVEPASTIKLDANGGHFYNETETRSEAYLVGGKVLFAEDPRHPDEEQIGTVFNGWATTKNAAEPDIDLENPEDVATLTDGQTLYANWIQGVKVTFQTDVGDWEIDGATMEPVTTLSFYYKPGITLEDTYFPRAQNHPDGLKNFNEYQDAEGNRYFEYSVITEDVVLYPIWREVFTATYHAGAGTFTGTEDPAVYVEKNLFEGNYLSVYERFFPYKPTPNDPSLIFAGWSLKENGGLADIQKNSIKIEESVDLYAVYLPKIHVTAIVNNPEYGKISESEYGSGTDTLTLETWEGAALYDLHIYYDYDDSKYILLGTSTTKDGTELLARNYAVKDGEKLYYIYAKGYNIAFVAEKGYFMRGGAQVGEDWQQSLDGHALAEAFEKAGEPIREGYTFDGWATKDAEGNLTPVFADTVPEHPEYGLLVLHALWTDKPSVKEAKITLSKTTYTYNGKECKPTVTVTLADGTVLTKDTDYTVTYADNINAGTATVTIKGTGNYAGTTQAIFTISKAKNSITQTKTYGKSYSTKKQTIQLAKTAKYEKAKLTYKASNSKIKVSSTGLVTIPAKFSGKFTVTITSKATTNYAAGAKVTVTVYIPTKPTISKVTNSASKTMKVTWKKASVAQGYQVQYSTSSKFKKAKTVTVKKQATVKATIKKLTKGKKYYVRVRSYYTVSSKKYYSAWSATKTVTIKK